MIFQNLVLQSYYSKIFKVHMKLKFSPLNDKSLLKNLVIDCVIHLNKIKLHKKKILKVLSVRSDILKVSHIPSKYVITQLQNSPLFHILF